MKAIKAFTLKYENNINKTHNDT